MRDHQVTLTTNECAALLAAAKTVLEAYSDSPERQGEHTETLQSSVRKIADGMGLSSSKTEDLLQFMDTGKSPNNPWGRAFS